MADKKLKSSSGYFNKDMLAILNKSEAKTTKKTSSPKKTTKKSK